MKTVCRVCAGRCALEEGQTGFCKVRVNRDGIITSNAYGKVTSLALVPIENRLITSIPAAVFYRLGAMDVILPALSARIMKFPWQANEKSLTGCFRYTISVRGRR